MEIEAGSKRLPLTFWGQPKENQLLVDVRAPIVDAVIALGTATSLTIHNKELKNSFKISGIVRANAGDTPASARLLLEVST